MKNLKILFFDTTWNQLLRFGNTISNLIKEQDSNVVSYGVVCERIKGKKQSHNFNYVFDSNSNRLIANYVRKTKPDIVILVQNTVPDQNVILSAKKIGAMVFVLQHGMLYEGASLNNFNAHELFAALLNLGKTLKYLRTMHQMCKYDHQSYFGLLKKIVVEKKDVAHILQNHFSVKLNGDYAMVVGEHWIDYYCEHYEYARDKILLMGNHDVDNVNLDVTLEDAICYIPSVHVEDGKVRPSVFNKFINNLAESIKKTTKLYIKMHPRGDINLYKDAFKNHNVTYVTGPNLPPVTTYIGHNSTLLAKALLLTNKVILWGFKEEAELFYKPWAFAFCNKPDELKAAIEKAESEKENNEVSKEIREISYINPEGAFNYAARNILALYKNNNPVNEN